MKIIIPLTFLLFSSLFTFTVAQTSDTLSTYYYRQAVNALSNNRQEKAKELFKQSLSEKDNAPAEYELAKIYKADSSHAMWNISREHIKNAIKIEPGNIVYRLFYASLARDLSKKYFNEAVSEFDEKKQYEKILEIDSTNNQALEGLAQIEANNFLEFNLSRRRYDNQDADSVTVQLERFLSKGFRIVGRVRSQQINEVLYSLDTDYKKFAQEDFRQAESNLTRAIKYDSLNLDLYFSLCSIFEDNNMPGKGIPYLLKLRKFYPLSWKLHLNLGLLYYRSGQIDSSYSEYQEALNMMSDSERIDFTFNSVKILLTPYLKDKMSDLSRAQLKKIISAFWKSRDPLIITGYNERLLEHYTRVAYANLRFSVPNLGLKGWQTDRGITVIKYGIPPTRFRYRPEMQLSGNGLVEKYKTDVWIYDDKIFGFVDEIRNGNFQFSQPDAKVGRGGGQSQFWDDSKEFIQNLAATQPDSYTPVFNGPLFNVPYNTIQLKDFKEPELTDVIISYGIKVDINTLKDSTIKYTHKTGIYFFDKYFNKVADNENLFKYLDVQNAITIPDSGRFIINTVEMKSPPDSGNMSFEILRTADKGVASYHGRYVVKNYDTKSLVLSNILLASNIYPESEEGPIKRKNISILPNPAGIFSKNQDIYLYYEVYNLSLAGKGITDFNQDIILQKKEEKGLLGKIFSPVLKTVGLDNQQKQVSLTSKFQTKDRNSQIYFQLDMGNYEPGNYVLTVKVKDNISGKETEQSTELTWK